MDYEKEYQYYLQEYYRVPRNIKDKLKYMPNNKGYICNGIYLYGYQKSTSSKISIFFEKIYPYLYIHEITKYNHKIFQMNIKTRDKKFISNTTRRFRNM